MKCAWRACGKPFAPYRDAQRFCSKRCRQAAHRLRGYVGADASPVDVAASLLEPRRIAYADPPFPGMARRCYGPGAAEVNHASLIDRLATYDGWALSTSADALRELLPMAPAARLCVWVKPKSANQSKRTRGPHNVFEAVLVKPARLLRPGTADALVADAARLGCSDLTGRKPLHFCAWLFRLLGASPADSFNDMFPGSGIVGAAWAEFVAAGSRDASSSADATPRQIELEELLEPCARSAAPADFASSTRVLALSSASSHAPHAQGTGKDGPPSRTNAGLILAGLSPEASQ